MAKNNQRDPNLRAATVARVNQLVKGGLTKAGAFEKISAETGRAKDAVQMLYYRAIRASKAGSKASVRPAAAAKPTAPRTAPRTAAPAVKSAPPSRSRKSARPASRPQGAAAAVDLPALLNGIAAAINNLLKHVEKTVQENKTLKEQAGRLHAITSLIRGK